MIENEGNEVSLYIQDPSARGAWEGLLPKVKRIAPDKDTVAIFDFSGMGATADKLRAAGVPVVGGSRFADRMEEDRQFGTDLMVEAGIRVPLTVELDKFNEVDGFLKEYGEDEDGCERRFVFKPSGKGLPSHLTYVSSDNEDLRQYVGYVEKNYAAKVDSFVLQEFIEGVAVSTEAYCDGTRFVRPYNHTLEVKGFMDRNLGPATGCSGNIVWAEHGPCRIAANGLAKIEKAVAAAGHVGPIDLNAIVNEEGVWGLEWTPRMGYDSTPTQLFTYCGEIGRFMSDLARGQLTADMPLQDIYGVGVRMSVPPYPLEPLHAGDVERVRPNDGIPIRGLTNTNSGKFYFYEVAEREGQLIHCDGMGALGVAIDADKSPHRAFDRVYDALNELKVPELQYRTDLGCVLCDMLYETERLDGVSLGALRAEDESDD